MTVAPQRACTPADPAAIRTKLLVKLVKFPIDKCIALCYTRGVSDKPTDTDQAGEGRGSGKGR